MESFRTGIFARTVENRKFHNTLVSFMEGNGSTPVCREYSEPRNSQCSRIQAILIDHVKIGPVTGIEVFRSAGTLVIEVQSTVTITSEKEVLGANINDG